MCTQMDENYTLIVLVSTSMGDNFAINMIIIPIPKNIPITISVSTPTDDNYNSVVVSKKKLK